VFLDAAGSVDAEGGGTRPRPGRGTGLTPVWLDSSTASGPRKPMRGRVRPMLSVPCGLPSYVGPWPPVAAGREVIQPLADLAKSTPHSACASGGGAMYGRPPQPGADDPKTDG